MENIGSSEGLFQDMGEVESFKIALGARLMGVFRNNCGVCHIQALLGEAITKKSSKTRLALTLSIEKALDESANRPKIHKDRIRFLVNEALKNDFGEDEANTGLSDDEMNYLGLLLPNNVSYSRDSRELSAGEELPF